MPLYSWLLSSLLVSQIGANPSVPATAAPPSTNPRGPAVPAATYPGNPPIGGAIVRQPTTAPDRVAQPTAVPLRATTGQLVSDALTLPTGSTIGGQPVPLVSVVATAPDRQRQIKAVHAYWRLAAATGEYHFSNERQQRLARLRAGKDEAADLRTAQAMAAAQIRESELQVMTAQHDLAEILALVPGTPLLLPADQPLVGPYRTLFAELFAGKMAPERARMLDQTLPLRNRAIESHATALIAAEDALDAAIELQAGGQGHLADVIAALDAQVRQQQAFLAAVCRYNHDIADYALAVVSPQTTPDVLVSTLIKQNRPAGQPVTPLPTTATLPAAYQQPIVAPAVPASGNVAFGSGGVPPAMPNWPTRAMQPRSAAGQNSEAATPVRAEVTTPAGSPAVAPPPNPPQSNDPEEPRLAPPQESAIPIVEQGAGSREEKAGKRKQEEGLAPPAADAKSPSGPTTRSSQKPIGENGTPRASAAETYSGLVGLTPAERTVKLAVVLYCDRNSPSPAGQPMRLIDCLRTVTMNGRSNVAGAYWTVWQTAVKYQGLVEQIQWLEALEPTLSAQNPPSPTAMLKLRAARLAAEAERIDTEADWTMARYQLAGMVDNNGPLSAGSGNRARGNSAKTALPQPVSVPFVGRLPLRVSPSDRSWSQRRLEAAIPQLEHAIIDQATVVVEADASRAAATADFLAGRTSVERVLAGIELQVRATSAFLQGVTDYNRAIYRYAITTLPANTEVEKVVAALMVE